MTGSESLDASVEALLRARSESRRLPTPGLDMVQSYEVAARLREALIAEGHRMIGRKLGFTNPSIWPELGVSEPIWAPIYDTTVSFLEGRALGHVLAGAVAPRIELEVVLRLSSVSPPAIDWAALGYEIVHCHFPEWKFSCADAVADFGLHRALLVGEPLLHLERFADLEVSLSRNGELMAQGEGKSVLGGPENAIEWLRTILDRQPDAPSLEPGEIMTTGTMTGALPVTAGESWEARATGGPKLPGISLTFTE